jgi:hypothetical protein
MKKNTKGLTLPSGITLRDYFAGQALIATYKNSVDLYNEGGFCDDDDTDVIYSDAAKKAYLVAEEMLKRKNKYDSE